MFSNRVVVVGWRFLFFITNNNQSRGQLLVDFGSNCYGWALAWTINAHPRYLRLNNEKLIRIWLSKQWPNKIWVNKMFRSSRNPNQQEDISSPAWSSLIMRHTSLISYGKDKSGHFMTYQTEMELPFLIAKSIDNKSVNNLAWSSWKSRQSRPSQAHMHGCDDRMK